MDNMEIYKRFADVPKEAQKEIAAGRLKGMTDINPMWRIRCLTEAFGPCGIGWKVRITNKEIVQGANGEAVAIVDAYLQIKVDGEWSDPIEGTGGASFVASEKNGLRTSDEAFKMAYTDALSVCCKLLGIGANVYWQGGRTKYSGESIEEKAQRFNGGEPPKLVCEDCGHVVIGYTGANGKPVSPEKHIAAARQRYGKVLCLDCVMKRRAEESNAYARN